MATALSADDVLIGTANGPGIWMAPVGTTAPTDATTALPADWSTLGYLSEDGVTLSQSTNSEDIYPWQGRSPVRTMITERNLSMEFSMFEFNEQNLQLYFGMEQAVTAGDTWSLNVVSNAPAQIYAFVIDVADLDVKVRYYIPRGSLSDAGDLEITDSGVMALPVTLKTLDSGGELMEIFYDKAAAQGGFSTRTKVASTEKSE
jgi:hypothetical protein